MEKQFAIYSIDKKVQALYHDIALQVGLSDSAFWVFYCLCASTEIHTQNSIAEWSCMPKQTINSAINKLVAADYLQLEKAVSARNSKYVHLTEKGRAFCKKNVMPIINAETKAFSRLSGEEYQAFLAVYEKQLLFLQEEFANELERIQGERKKRTEREDYGNSVIRPF